MMGPAEAIRTCLRKYVTISGRASRSEFWWFYLAVSVIGAVLSAIDGLVFGFGWNSVSILEPLLALLTFLPVICVAGRRLHDYDLSAWWLLIILIPVLGFLFLLAIFVQRGTVGPNPHGPDPLFAAGPE